MKIVLALLLSAATLLAQAANVGDTLTPWTLNDQFDQPYTLDQNTRILLVARDMKAAQMVKAAIEDQPKGYLQARHAVFLADVHGMPSLIGKLFAIPSMKGYNYRVVLDRDGKIADQYPGAKEQILLLQLDNGKLVSQQAFTTATALREALDNAPTR
ncbi:MULTISPECIES: FAD/FMN-containing dehydrogenase [Pseudomonas]|uniref:FAD/FMN-containing dehydrogenase n=1 Tax=Pseudomonas TaxID=286 RepID=UPI001472F647|nr:FAD/FMN-containing dehydrogenase [Pseudomonas sp.]MBS5838745.1 FAD/FMN-containing dehydrogenase [Pseudomonas sp.]NMZ98302.1 FAD/FMN-containing dehydrogenase [Pseudomonas lundensis]